MTHCPLWLLHFGSRCLCLPWGRDCCLIPRLLFGLERWHLFLGYHLLSWCRCRCSETKMRKFVRRTSRLLKHQGSSRLRDRQLSPITLIDSRMRPFNSLCVDHYCVLSIQKHWLQCLSLLTFVPVALNLRSIKGQVGFDDFVSFDDIVCANNGSVCIFRWCVASTLLLDCRPRRQDLERPL